MSEQGQVDTVGGAHGSGVASLGLGAQYTKIVTFSAPTTPEVFFNLPARPHIGLRLDVNARQLGENQPNFEVTLVMHAQGFRASPTPEAPSPDVLYTIELSYAGLFTLQNAAQDDVERLLLIEAPRHLFPAARNVLLNLVREAGFPVANLQPVDFQALWQARRGQK